MTDQLRVQALELAQKLFPTQNPQELVASAHTLEGYLRQGLPKEALADAVPAVPQATRVWSTSDILTLNQCSRNPAFFASKLTIVDPMQGNIPFNPMAHQRDILAALQTHNRVAICSARQLGTTTVLAAFALWHATFNAEQTIVLCSDRLNRAIEIMDRIRCQMDGLPQVIRPGIVRWNKGQIELDNGSKIIARALTRDAVRGFAVNLLMLDNATYVSHSVGDDFMQHAMPMLAATRTKIVMASNAGDNKGMFYHAMQDPSYYRITLPWTVHPEHDTEWADSMRTAIGPASFAREYECEFDQPAV